MFPIRTHVAAVEFNEAAGGVARLHVDLEVNLPAIAAFDHHHWHDSLSEHLSVVLTPLFDQLRAKRDAIIEELKRDERDA